MPHGRLTARMLTLLLGVMTALILGVPHASAHAGLKSSDPKDGARLQKAPTEVTLVFTESINRQFARIVVTGPNGEVADGEPAITGPKLTQPLTAGLPNGKYRIAFRVVSADGHPISKELTFTLDAAEPSPSPGTTSAAAESPAPVTPGVSSAANEDTGGGSTVPVLVIGLGLVAAVLVAFLVGRSRGSRMSAQG